MLLKKLFNWSSSYKECIVSQINFFFIVKFVLVSLKVLDHSCFLKTLLVQLKFFLLTMVDNLVTYIENKNFTDFTIEDGER